MKKKVAAPPLTKVAECLYRNQHGTYFALVKVHGKQIKRSLNTDDSALAKRRLSELRKKAESLTGTDKGLLFDGLAVRWLAMKKPDLKPASHERLECAVRCVSPFFKGLPVRSIGQAQIEAWKMKRGTKIGARSFNHERDTIRQIFEYARLNLRIILDNPAETLKKRKVGNHEATIPTKEQFRSLMDALRAQPKAQEAANLVEFLAYSGLRLGKAREVRWNEVNFTLNTLLITGGEGGTKNHDSRAIPLSPPLRRLLERFASGCPALGDARIFAIDSAKKALFTACRNAGLPQFGHHAMRHFFCSNAIEAGIDFKAIAGWLGHKDGGVLVARTYGHLRNEHSAAMAQRMTFGIDEAASEENVVAFTAHG
ncbi:MAG: hypothetical protein QOD99_2939 [Chthoniobacter sp.]|jgi:integrase|nr:hypothetical protein [Chthoniobacter sp.]